MKKWLKVLIVDDEMPIRQEMSSYHWEENRFQLNGTARNGKIALDMCRGDDKPDIVITDITMPVMDGLELIEHLKNEFPSMKYIILTCHQDFNYAKKAIQYNVEDYIVKSDISEEVVFKVLQKTRRTFERESTQLENQKQNIRVELAELINAQSAELETIKKKLYELGIDLCRYQQVLLLFVENRILSWVVVELAIRIFISEYAEIENWIVVDQGCYCVIIQDLDKNKIRYFLEQLDRMIQDKFSYAKEVFLVYGAVLNINGTISQFLNEIKDREFWINEHFINPWERIFCLPVPSLKKSDKEIEESLKKILMESCSEDIVRNILNWEKKHRLVPQEMKRIIVENLRRRCEISMPEKAAEMLNFIMKSRDMNELSKALLHIYQQEESRQGRYEIRRARKIIEDQYGKALSLTEIAQEVNLSPQYFSRLFSETVGTNFVDYLMDVRMKHAQEMILSSDKKVYEIACEVGIPNYRYFTAIFKKYYGVTPKEYKNKGIGR